MVAATSVAIDIEAAFNGHTAVLRWLVEDSSRSVRYAEVPEELLGATRGAHGVLRESARPSAREREAGTQDTRLSSRAVVPGRGSPPPDCSRATIMSNPLRSCCHAS